MRTVSNKYPIMLTFWKKRNRSWRRQHKRREITISQIPRRTLEEFARMTAKGGVWTPSQNHRTWINS